MAKQIRVTRRQAELAQAKVEADRALHRRPDPILALIAAAAAPEAPPDGRPTDSREG